MGSLFHGHDGTSTLRKQGAKEPFVKGRVEPGSQGNDLSSYQERWKAWRLGFEAPGDQETLMARKRLNEKPWLGR